MTNLRSYRKQFTTTTKSNWTHHTHFSLKLTHSQHIWKKSQAIQQSLQNTSHKESTNTDNSFCRSSFINKVPPAFVFTEICAWNLFVTSSFCVQACAPWPPWGAGRAAWRTQRHHPSSSPPVCAWGPVVPSCAAALLGSPDAGSWVPSSEASSLQTTNRT